MVGFLRDEEQHCVTSKASSIDYSTFDIMWKNEWIATVKFTREEFHIKRNLTHVKRIFRFTEQVTRKDILRFIEEQIFDKTNARKERILEILELEEYEPWDIFEKTRGVSVRNRYWIKFKGEDLDYEKDIKTGKFLYS